MFLFQLALLLLLLAVCSFAPGFFFIRRLRWTPLEKLCGSIGLSLALLYLAAWGIYCFGPHDPRGAYWAVAAASVALGALAWRDAWRLARTFRVRQALAGFGFLLLWIGAMLAMIRIYSGAGWAGDWLEHFQRSLFFLNRLPRSNTIFGGYAVPARPPLMNVLAAFFLGLTADRFELFQVIFAFLNLLIFFACFLLLPALGGGRAQSAPRRLTPLVALLAASPVVMENVTYTWTKALPAFYVVLALALYLAGLRKRDSRRVVAAFVALAVGFLAHYSVGPYIAFLAIHYLVMFYRRRPRPWAELAAIAVACGLLLTTWFGWSVAAYGAKTTFASNTSITSSEQSRGHNLEKIALNLYDTLVPGWLRGSPVRWDQASAEGLLRDQAFTFYQHNLLFGMGVMGGPLILFLLWRILFGGAQMRRERGFWRLLIPFCIVVGVAVVGERDVNGVPHLTLLALEVLGLSMLAAHFRSLGRGLRFLIVAGCLLDFGFGVFLQARIEGLENTPDRPIFGETYQGGQLLKFASLNEKAWLAWFSKHRVAVCRQLLQEIPAGHAAEPQFAAAWPPIAAGLEGSLADDPDNFGGWAGRHGGEVTYLGDWVAGVSGNGTDTAAAVFVLLFLGLMAGLTREALWKPAAPVRTGPANARKRRPKRAAAR